MNIEADRISRPCPTCGAPTGERCHTWRGDTAQWSHAARFYPPGTWGYDFSLNMSRGARLGALTKDALPGGGRP